MIYMLYYVIIENAALIFVDCFLTGNPTDRNLAAETEFSLCFMIHDGTWYPGQRTRSMAKPKYFILESSP